MKGNTEIIGNETKEEKGIKLKNRNGEEYEGKVRKEGEIKSEELKRVDNGKGGEWREGRAVEGFIEVLRPLSPPPAYQKVKEINKSDLKGLWVRSASRYLEKLL